MKKGLLLIMSSTLISILLFVNEINAQTNNPTLSVDLDTLNFEDGTVCVGRSQTMTLTVNGENLKGDILLESNSAEITLSKTKILKTEGIGIVEVTVDPKQIKDSIYGDVMKADIIVSTEGVKEHKVLVSWWVAPTAKNLSDVKERAKLVREYEYFQGIIIGEVSITKEFIKDELKYAYVQDGETAECCFITTTLVAKDNDVYKNIYVYYDENGYMIHNYGELVRNKYTTPKNVTIAELTNNTTKYENWLVKLSDITFNGKEFNSGEQIQISQAQQFIFANAFDGSDLIGMKIPADPIDIVGVFHDNDIISLRSKTDLGDNIPSIPDNIDNVSKEVIVWSVDNMLRVDLKELADVEVYNTVGQRLDCKKGVVDYSLQVEDGIYLVKVNGQIFKTIVK